jgi:hypothetical protein
MDTKSLITASTLRWQSERNTLVPLLTPHRRVLRGREALRDFELVVYR